MQPHNDFIKISLQTLNDKYEFHFSHFEKLLDAILCLYVNRIENDKVQFNQERLYYTNLLSQKFIVHGFSIKKLIDGITLDSPSKKLNIKMLDPFSIHSLVRTIIENYLVLNYLTSMEVDKDELECRFEIWMRYGLLQRNADPEFEEAKRVIELDKKGIERFEKSIKSRIAFKNLTEEKKNSFFKTINKEWKIIFDGNKFYTSSWKRLIKEAGIKNEINENVYNFLSWHAHSQSISLLQLKNMWNENSDRETIKMSIKKLNMFISFMASDIIKSDIEFENAYQSLDQDYKDLINFYNMSYRNSNYMIEQLKN